MTKPFYRRVALIDGSGFIYRAYFSFPFMTNPDGLPVNAVYGFCSLLMNLIHQLDVDAMAVAFDDKSPSFRTKIFPAYKAQRPPIEENLRIQMPLFREATRAAGIPILEEESLEADDLIASYAKALEDQGSEVVIITSDKDMIQLLSPRIHIFDPVKNRPTDLKVVKDKFDITPDKMIDFQALAGDSSDNIPGVPSIGPKTAALLLNMFGTLENLYDHLEDVPQNGRRKALEDHKAAAFLSKTLVTLKTDAALPADLDRLRFTGYCEETLRPFFQKHNFRSLLRRLDGRPAAEEGPAQERQKAASTAMAETSLPAGNSTGSAKSLAAFAAHLAKEASHYTLVLTQEDLAKVLQKAAQSRIVALDTETDSLDAHGGKLLGFSLSWNLGEAVYVPVEADSHHDLFHKKPEQPSLSLSAIRPLLGPLLESDLIRKVGHNIRYDAHILSQSQNGGFRLRNFEDTLVMAALCQDAGGPAFGGLGLKETTKNLFGVDMTAFEALVPKKGSFADVPLEEAVQYAAADADFTLRLYRYFRVCLTHKKLASLYQKCERPLTEILYKAESKGALIDVASLEKLSAHFQTEKKRLEGEIFEITEPFNLASPQQIGDVLFNKLGLESFKKTRTGQKATGSSILESLAAEGQELAKKILDWRQFAKLDNTYAQALMKSRDSYNRVHTFYTQAITTTGRLSSTNPNLQNIPIRTEEGRLVRQAFIAPEGYLLISADYSQVELRLLAHIADVKALKKAFRDDQDIHAKTASEVFGCPLEAVTSDQRRAAKAINFGLIYGMSAFGLAQQLKIGQKEAQNYMTTYFATFGEIQSYMEAQRQKAKTEQSVRTLLGRLCPLPPPSPKLKGFRERVAINAPIQGSAADLIKCAMIDVDTFLSQKYPSVSLLLQVHDELVFEAPADIAKNVAHDLQTVMEKTLPLSIPLKVDAGLGKNWQQAH